MNRRGFLKFLPLALPGLGLASITPKPETLPVGVPAMVCQKCLHHMDISIYNGYEGKFAKCPNQNCDRCNILVEVIWIESKVVR